MSKAEVINEILGLYDEVRELKAKLEFDKIHQEIFNFGRQAIWEDYGKREYFADSIISWDGEKMSFNTWFNTRYTDLPPFMSKNEFKKEFDKELRERYERKKKEAEEAEADGESE